MSHYPPRYPVVLLDVGETLIGPRISFGAVYAEVLSSLGVDLAVDALDRALGRTWEEFDRTIPPGKDRYAYYPGGEDGYWIRYAGRAIALAAGRGLEDELVDRALPLLKAAFRERDAWRVYEDVRPALDSLRRDGVRLAVVSNWDSRLPGILQGLDLDGYFETLAVSHSEGVEKPDPALFRAALERMAARPEDAFYVGDRPELDLEGARAAGIDAVLVDRKNRLDGSFPTIPDLSSLPRIAQKGV